LRSKEQREFPERCDWRSGCDSNRRCRSGDQLQTAAGVAGGALLFEGINSLFHHGGPWGGGGSFLPTGGAPTLVEETVINEYGGGAQPEALAEVAGSNPAAGTSLCKGLWYFRRVELHIG
jgi:hypothetical protein